MIDHIEYEAFEGLKNNLSSKFGYFCNKNPEYKLQDRKEYTNPKDP